MAPGCPERLTLELLSYIWNFPHKGRAKIVNKLETYRKSKQVIILQSPQQVSEFLS